MNIFKVKVVLRTDAEPQVVIKYEAIENSSANVIHNAFEIFEDSTIVSITVKSIEGE